MKPPPLLVFADDWGRHPSSCQHLVRHLLPQHQTLWVNTIGTRAPKLDGETLRRAAGKFKQWFRPKPKVAEVALPANLQVVNPKMWPWFTRKLDRNINRELLLRQLKPLLANLPTAPIAITTLPIVADLLGPLPVAKWVYYCVDDFGEWPGLDRRTMTNMEALVVQRAETILAVSDNLQQRLARMGRKATLLTHGVDVDFWRQPALSPAVLEKLERPLVVFWGVVDRRMDVGFVARLAHDLKQGTLVFAGPQQNPDPALLALPRTVFTGALPFADLPGLAHEASVLIMPYADLPVTRAMQPLKLKEYLATGKPAVGRNLPANLEWGEALDLVESATAFSALVRERLTTGLPSTQANARKRLEAESWAAKAEVFGMCVNRFGRA